MGRRRPASFTRLDRALRRAWALGVQRRSLPWPPWRQLSLVVTGIIVAVAMVTIAELARENGDRHRRAQVVVESIQAASEQLDAITAQALADSLASHARGPRLSITLLAGAIGAWKGITGALVQLSSLESDSRTARLHRDAQALFDVGVKTLDSVKGIPPSAALRIEQHEFSPTLARLGLDAVARPPTSEVPRTPPWRARRKHLLDRSRSGCSPSCSSARASTVCGGRLRSRSSAARSRPAARRACGRSWSIPPTW